MKNSRYLKFGTDVTPNSYIFSAHSSIGGKLIQKFKRGDIPIETTLDLHGYTLEQAADTLEGFLIQCLENNYRCVLVIHGKGSLAILKNHVNRCLDDHPKVLAFCSAKQKDGGNGAVYVLLKTLSRNKEDYETE